MNSYVAMLLAQYERSSLPINFFLPTLIGLPLDRGGAAFVSDGHIKVRVNGAYVWLDRAALVLR